MRNEKTARLVNENTIISPRRLPAVRNLSTEAKYENQKLLPGPLLALLLFTLISFAGAGSAFAASVDILSVTIGAQGGTAATYGTANSAITYAVAIGGDGNSGGGTVTPSVSGLPAGVTGVFSPTSATRNNSPGTNNFTLRTCP